MPEPVIDPAERVAPPVTRQATPPNTPPNTPPKQRTNTEFWNDPTGATKEIVQSEAERIIKQFETAGEGQRRNMIESARLICKDRHPEFMTFAEEVEKIVNNVGGAQAADPVFWETTLTFVKGQRYETAVKDAEAKGRMPAETGSPAATAPIVPITISTTIEKGAGKSEAMVAAGLGLTNEEYLKGRENMENDKFPLTMDNRRKR